MDTLFLFDLPSLFFILNSLLIGFIVGGKNIRKSLSLARDISIPIGVSGTVLGCTIMLSRLDDPSVIAPALGVAILGLVYSLMLYILLNAIIYRIEPLAKSTEAIEQLTPQTIGGCISLFVFVCAGVLHHKEASLTLIINPEAILLVFVSAPLLARLESSNRKDRIIALGKYSLLTAFVAVLFSASILLHQWEDPSSIGPAMAMGLLSFLYGGMLYTIANILHHFSYEESFSFSKQGSASFLLTTLLIVIPTNLILLHSVHNWGVTEDLLILKKSKSEQDSLLRELAYQQIDNTGTITISTDKDAWIFIDDQLIRQSPVSQFKLAPGKHNIKIASCPNTSETMNKPDNDVTWLEYWGSAYDGSCNEPSEEDIQKLIKQGLVKEVVLGEHVTEGENIVHMTYDFSPKLNFCCDENLTKEFTVTMDKDSLTYVWSFADNKWLVEARKSLQIATPKSHMEE